MSPEGPIDRAQRRREMTWFLVAVLGVAAVWFSGRWWMSLLDHMDPVTATASALVVTGALVASSRRRGLGWSAVRLLCVAAILVAITMAALVAVCIPSGCFN
jgi:xanthine/uracil/vitamin C permease (AzgA family)